MINSVTLIGHLGAKPELRKVESGVSLAFFSVATNENYKDKTTNEYVTKTEWHRVTVWREQAERLAEQLDKGNLVYIEGKLTNRKFTDKDGNERYTTEITATTVRRLTPRDVANAEMTVSNMVEDEPAF
jgi:single-strand DNA-binding protein